MMKIKTDIFICTETWNIKSINLYKLDGYNLHYSEGNLNIADDVIVYVKKNVRYGVNIIKIAGMNVIRVDLIDQQNNKYIVTAIYKLHSIIIPDFNLALEKYLEENSEIQNQIIIGDMNINLNSCNENVIEYTSIMAKYGFSEVSIR